MNPKIVFFGTPENAKNVLEILYAEKKLEICAVVTSPDAPVGRKQIVTPSPVKNFALEKNIPVLTPHTAKDEDFEKNLEKLQSDFFVVVAYGKILPQKILDIPKKGAFNLHFSLLPKYRGASPLQSALLHGEKISGYSIFKIVLPLDAGEIFTQEKINVEEKIFEEILAEMTEKGGEKMKEMVLDFENFSGEKQEEKEATFCGKICKEDGKVDFATHTAEEIWNRFRAFHLWPGIFFLDTNGKRVKILDMQKCEDVSAHEKKCIVQTKSGFLELKILQKEGKNPVEGKNYFPPNISQILEK